MAKLTKRQKALTGKVDTTKLYAIDSALALVKEPSTGMFVDWQPYLGHNPRAVADTRVPLPTLQELAARLSDLPAGLVHILCTDISRDGKLTGPNSALYAQLVKKFPSLQIQASGGVSSLDDLRMLRGTGAAGAIVGRALYENKFTLKEALAC